MVTTVTEKLVADTIAAEIYISSVIVMQDTGTVLVDSQNKEIETVISTGERGPPGLSEEEMVYAKRTDFVGDDIVYRGEAPVGTLNSAAAWRIRKITIASDSDIIEEWADGSPLFTNIWNNRLSLFYY